jgi:tryptophanyl-tRNA synthetase
MRERYEALIAQPIEIEAVLREGADKARRIAAPLLADLRHAVGLRDLRSAAAPLASSSSPAPQAQASTRL